MKISSIAVAAVSFVVQGALATDERPQLAGVSAVRVANYGTPSTVLQDREQVSAIVGELRQLRNKPWRRVDTKLSCYATLVLIGGDRTVSLFRISPEAIVERAPGKGQSTYSIAIDQADVQRIGPLLTKIPPPKDCN